MQVNNDDMINSEDFIREFKNSGYDVANESEAMYYLEMFINDECHEEVGNLTKYVEVDNKLYELDIDYMISYRELVVTNVKTTLITNYFDDKKDIIYNWLIEIECNKVEINKIEEILKKYGIKINII